MTGVVDATIRRLRNLRRPSAAANASRLRARGEQVASLVVRDAISSDLPALARLHVETWNATHRGGRSGGPTIELRERQWREAFSRADGSWFCVVLERADGALVGFAKGTPYAHADLPAFAGELSKIYLLEEYQRLGLGRRLVGHVARRFLSRGIESMVLFGDARNPSSACWDALGGEPLPHPDGSFSGSYGWRDLRRLADACPTD
jgi:ribosomal protein S18 acetylase RimI-like enzyme